MLSRIGEAAVFDLRPESTGSMWRNIFLAWLAFPSSMLADINCPCTRCTLFTSAFNMPNHTESHLSDYQIRRLLRHVRIIMAVCLLLLQPVLLPLFEWNNEADLNRTEHERPSFFFKLCYWWRFRLLRLYRYRRSHYGWYNTPAFDVIGFSQYSCVGIWLALNF